MDTFDRISELLRKNKMTQADLARKTGISTGLISQWKNRSQNPSAEKLQKVAECFNVSVDYLLGNEQKEKPLVNNDEELTAYLEELKTRPEMKMLFNLAKGATKEDVEKAVKIVEAFLKKD
ncbi:helix-turn-helix transcriptional regulator [Caproiciproducens galactitolivorans]|jgi:transcriptional regulator with XRE-family HTH domain|uniref:HTH-type transcriptional regulator Xre n=1 Tax=Caproiciproducens galactitolivorans TaxID=642589 RepID=A0A4Z0YDG9_9FIRM|nr:helix-turn-helix transcriptional regulator [Caproiciproducens galactitolivorans]QEY34655.1 helix-turn-helix transcriptional regulator [Caproiciproducens galactitolivorans]TGJ75876.1 HTH-type transcriptional regulator Xre [Caproiciproducens galactitolivorans]